MFGVVVQPGTTRDQKKTGWRIYHPKFLQEDCIGCLACFRSCPDGAVYKIDKRKFDADMDACKGCGVCAELCPVDDIDMELESLECESGEPAKVESSKVTEVISRFEGGEGGAS